ncbi:7633_t:CDS:2, partial [Paraglomus brasilianum]
MSHNYFLNNAGASENIRGLEAWIVWQKLNNVTNLVETTTAAKKGYLEEITKAIDWAEGNARKMLKTMLENEKKDVNKINAGIVAEFISEAEATCKEIRKDSQYEININTINKNITTIRNHLVTIIPSVDIEDEMEVINPLRPIAAGVLDTSGSDNLWTKMVAKDGAKLVDRKKAAYICSDDKRCLIDSIKTPKGLDDEPESVKLQVHAAHKLLENLRFIWQNPEGVNDYNEGTYVVDIISQLLQVLRYGEKAFWLAEEISEASSRHHKSDMRVKVNLPDKESLEILFLESSRPNADLRKFLLDWVKLIRMGKDAHVRMFDTMTKHQPGQLGKSIDGKEFLRRVGAIPILLIQVHCLNVKIAILDRPYCVYYQKLEDFVCRWLRLVEYLNKIADQLRDLQQLKRKQFFIPDDSDAM